MFESPAATRPVFRIDPWAVEYANALGIEDAGQVDTASKPFTIDYGAEPDDWTIGIFPVSDGNVPNLFFVDGVQRTEARGMVETGGRSFEAAMVSIAVGGVICEGGRARVDTWIVERVLALYGAVEMPTFVARAGRGELKFRPLYATGGGDSRIAIHNEVGRERSRLERDFAEQAMAAGRLVIVDGRLPDSSGDSPAVGLTKTIHERYLDDEHWQLVSRLMPCQRTPVFRIEYESRTSRYSWFLRLPHTRPISHALAGVIRLETSAAAGPARALELANLTAYHLPSFASKPQHDPRAPQNLLPVGGLERRLRHELGEPAFIRRAIEDQLTRELTP